MLVIFSSKNPEEIISSTNKHLHQDGPDGKSGKKVSITVIPLKFKNITNLMGRDTRDREQGNDFGLLTLY